MDLNKILDIYFSKFGESYPIHRGDARSTEEIIRDVQACIDENRKETPRQYEAEDDVFY